MDTKEVEDESRHDQERRNPFLIAGGAIVAAQHLHGFWGVLGGGWDEADTALAVRWDLDDLVIALLPSPGVAGRSALGESMQPSEDIRSDRDRAFAREDPIQRRSIPGELFLRAVSWLGSSDQQWNMSTILRHLSTEISVALLRLPAWRPVGRSRPRWAARAVWDAPERIVRDGVNRPG